MLSSIYTLRKNHVLFFVLIAVIRNRIVVVFWSLNMSIFLKNLIEFLDYYLSFAFAIFLNLESWGIWGQLIALLVFSGYQLFDHFENFGLFNVTKRFQ